MIVTSIDPTCLSWNKTFSICTLVTNKKLYTSMIESYYNAGFDDCEFLYIDNSENNKTDAYSGLNLMLSKASGKYIILCHQDILIKDNISQLENKLNELEKLDPNWAIVGNAGGVSPGNFSLYLEVPENKIRLGIFPNKVQTLDENWMLIKASTRLGFSNDLSGFHLYGTDICLQAEILGYNSYVIEYLLRHDGKGIQDPTFKKCKDALIKKYSSIFNNKIIQTTCCQIEINNTMEN